MKKSLIVDNTVCSGCLSCMINCSQFHEGFASLESARIKIELEPFSGVHKIRYCQQCEKAECAENCPQGAISYDEEVHCYVVDYELCIDCRTCVDVCPHGAMFYDPVRERVIKCDLCGGEPNCVDSCFTGALWWGEDETKPPDKLTSRYFLAEQRNEEGKEDA